MEVLFMVIGIVVGAGVWIMALIVAGEKAIKRMQWSSEVIEKLKPKIPDIITKEEFKRTYPKGREDGEIVFQPILPDTVIHEGFIGSLQSKKYGAIQIYGVTDKDEIDKCRLESKIIGERLVRTMRQHREETNLIMLANEFKRAQVNKSMYAIGRSI